MEKKVLRAGIIGSGFAAKFHVDALQCVFNTKVEIADVFSPNEKHLKNFAGPGNLKTFNSIEAVISEADVCHLLAQASQAFPTVARSLNHQTWKATFVLHVCPEYVIRGQNPTRIIQL